MRNKLILSASTTVLVLMLAGGAITATRAADVVEPAGCMLSGSVTAGYMFDWQNARNESEDEDGLDVDWDTPFGEGAGLVTCGGLNAQADVAYHAHSAEVEFDDDDWPQTDTHIGGALFFRDPASWAGGVGASWITEDIDSVNYDVFRLGLFGEFYLDAFTLGASVHYYNFDGFEEKDEDGFELAAWGKFYATPDLAFTLRGDVLLAEVEFSGEEGDLDGFAITGEGEYLVWDQGLSLFLGARYADRDFDVDDEDFSLDVEDFQVFGGVRFYFGHDGTLIERQRTGTVDNTSVFNEKLPEFFTSAAAAALIK